MAVRIFHVMVWGLSLKPIWVQFCVVSTQVRAAALAGHLLLLISNHLPPRASIVRNAARTSKGRWGHPDQFEAGGLQMGVKQIQSLCNKMRFCSDTYREWVGWTGKLRRSSMNSEHDVTIDSNSSSTNRLGTNSHTMTIPKYLTPRQFLRPHPHPVEGICFTHICNALEYYVDNDWQRITEFYLWWSMVDT